MFSALSGFGHITPMLPLATAFRDRGNDLVFASADDARSRIEAAELDFAPVGTALGKNIEEFRHRYPEAADLPGRELPEFMGPRLFGEIAAPRTLPDLHRLAVAWEPELVVHDTVDFAAPIAAAALGVPNVVHSFGAVIPSRRIAGAATYVESLWQDFDLEPRPYGGLFDHLYIDIYPPSMQVPGALSHVGRVEHLRPAEVAAGGAALPPAVATAVAGGRSVVYLTFGTVFNVNPTFVAAVDALAQRSDLVAVVTVGPAGDPGAFGALPPHVHVERFVPQEALLPRCAAVMSHGGSGTVLATLAHGLPQVVLPQGADQFLNADACVAAGAGLAIDAADADTAAIGAALSELLEREDLGDGARRVQAEIAVMPAPDTVAGTIESL